MCLFSASCSSFQIFYYLFIGDQTARHLVLPAAHVNLRIAIHCLVLHLYKSIASSNASSLNPRVDDRHAGRRGRVEFPAPFDPCLGPQEANEPATASEMTVFVGRFGCA